MFLQKIQVERHYMSMLVKLTGNPTMLSIRNGLLLTLPLLMAGCAAILINNLPIPAYQETMTDLFGESWKTFGANVYQGTFGVLALVMLYSISQHLVTRYNLDHPLSPVSPIIAALVSFSSLMIIVPTASNGDFIAAWLGSGGLFIAIVTSLVATKLFLRLMQVKLLRIALHAEGADTAIPQAFGSLLPGMVTLFLFGLLKTLLLLSGVESLHQLIHDLILYPFVYFQESLETGSFYILISQTLWFFGIHGPNVLDPITHEFFDTALAQNLAAIEAGRPIPHVVTKMFLDVFVSIGGSGSSFCLLLAILVTSKNNSNRRLAQISTLPAIFNINEMLLFGLPIILNPIFLIPFILVPLILSLISYLVFSWGWVPIPTFDTGWTTPPLMGGYIATGSILGAILQCFNLFVGTLLYIPFVRFSDRVKTERFKIAIDGLMAVAVSNAVGPSGKKCLDRDDEIGVLARALANDLEEAIKKNVGLYLEYQPQIDHRSGRVIGAEALVRWNHLGYGLIPAPIIVAVSEDGDFIKELGLWVLEEACAERRRWLDAGVDDVQMSVNLSVRQLEDHLLPQKVIRAVRRHDLPVSLIELEVTESVALNQEAQDNMVLHRIHELGIRVAIDDFGMGHSSLLYLKHFPVGTLKLDRALTKDVANSKACFEIITTIVDLCKAMEVDIVSEFIEDEVQIEILRRLGCYIFQGYYFSRPLRGTACLSYIRARNEEGVRLPTEPPAVMPPRRDDDKPSSGSPIASDDGSSEVSSG